MYNKVILMGRITKDLEIKTTPAGVSVLSFSLAVERNYAPKGEERQTDFINCVAWRQTAEFISKFFTKGSMILVEGELQTRQYQNKDGKNVTATEVIVSSSSFTGEKKQGALAGTPTETPTNEAPTANKLPGENADEEYPF
jgi:single-strand DNA-binding protein